MPIHPIPGSPPPDAEPPRRSEAPARTTAQSPAATPSQPSVTPGPLQRLGEPGRAAEPPHKTSASLARQRSASPPGQHATPPARPRTLSDVHLPLSRVLASPELGQQLVGPGAQVGARVESADKRVVAHALERANVIRITVGADTKAVTIRLDAEQKNVVSISAYPSVLSRDMLEHLVRAGVLHPSLLELDAIETRPDLANRISDDGRRLDLTHTFLDSVREVPHEVSEATRSAITELRLPGGLSEIPAWIEDLPNLRRLEIPYFAGATLSVLHPSLEGVYTSGGRLDTVEVAATTEVYCRGGPRDLPRKVKVVYRDPASREVVREGPAIGRLYYTSNDNSPIDYHVNLNAKAQFPQTGDDIVCRHLAVEWAHQIQRHRATRNMTRFVDQWAAKMADTQKIAGAVSPATNDRVIEAKRLSPEIACVGDRQWGAFFRDEFTPMLPGTAKQYLIVTSAHILGMELAVTGGEHGRRYVATYYDPNVTLNRARIMEDSLGEVAKWSGETFMTPSDAAQYYRGALAPRVSMFITMPADFHRRSMSEPLFDKPPASRTLRSYLAPHEQANGAASHFLFESAHITADALRSMLAQCRTSAQKMEILAGNSPLPNILLATLDQDRHAVSAFCSIVVDEQREGGLTNTQVFKLFADQQADLIPPFSAAMAVGDDEMVRTYVETIERLLMTGFWPSERKSALLKATTPGGRTAFAVARDAGRREAMQLYIDMLLRLVAAGRLTQQEFREL